MNTFIKEEKSFLKICIVPKLAAAVIKQVGGWEYFKEIAYDVAKHGGTSGTCYGFIYCSDTVKFAKAQRARILKHLRTTAAQIGVNGAYSLAATFNSLKGFTPDQVAEAIYVYNHTDQTTVLNALAWYALEETARDYIDVYR